MAHSRKKCITIFLTNECVCRCVYCYLGQLPLRREVIDVAFAKRGISDFFDHFASRHVRYFAAGEPTCAFAEMQEIYNFAHEIAGDRLMLEVQTSGIFSDAIAHWLGKKARIVWVSCDGPPDVQDALRPIRGKSSSSSIVERNIRTLLDYRDTLVVGTRATITPLNVKRQCEMIEYFSSLGVTAVFSDPVFPPVGSVHEVAGNWQVGGTFLMEYAQEYLKAQSRARELGIFYGSILTVNFDEETQTFCRACAPYPHLTTDGYVTCCDMAFSGKAIPLLVYGKYDSITGAIVYDDEKIKDIRRRNTHNLKECADCELLLHCAGGCFGEGVNESGTILGVKKDYCEAVRFLGRHLPLNSGLYPHLHP